jgi:serine phosphatase RsbU (regulator of sigma subunit)
VELGAGRAGFVLADVAGKGMSAALLMANCKRVSAANTQWHPKTFPKY